MLNNSILSIDGTIWCYHYGPGWPGSYCNERVLCIPQSTSITGASPSDYLVSYLGHSLGSFTPLQRCSRCILQPSPAERAGLCWDREVDEPHSTMSGRAHLILSQSYSQDFSESIFQLSWHCLNDEFLTTQATFLQPSGYWGVINCTFILHTRKIIWLVPCRYGLVQTCKA